MEKNDYRLQAEILYIQERNIEQDREETLMGGPGARGPHGKR